MDAQDAAATAEQQHPPQSMAEMFEEWMVEFERVYADAEVKARRFEIFKKSAERIVAFNASGESYTLGVNQFSDLTAEEFTEQYTFPIDDEDDGEEEGVVREEEQIETTEGLNNGVADADVLVDDVAGSSDSGR